MYNKTGACYSHLERGKWENTADHLARRRRKKKSAEQ
jgi:hypothetical protein